jgi:hypothetical protein
LADCSPSTPDPRISVVDTDCGDAALASRIGAAGPLIVDRAVAPQWVECTAILRHAAQRPLVAVLAARTVLRPGIAAALADWAGTGGMVSRGTRDDVRSVLQEAIVNAAVHGSFGLPGLDSFDGDWDAFTALVANGAATPRLGALPVVVSLRRLNRRIVVHIDDTGSGHAAPAGGMPECRGGRGFTIMRSLSAALHVSRRGCRISAGFDDRRT